MPVAPTATKNTQRYAKFDIDYHIKKIQVANAKLRVEDTTDDSAVTYRLLNKDEYAAMGAADKKFIEEILNDPHDHGDCSCREDLQKLVKHIQDPTPDSPKIDGPNGLEKHLKKMYQRTLNKDLMKKQKQKLKNLHVDTGADKRQPGEKQASAKTPTPPPVSPKAQSEGPVASSKVAPAKVGRFTTFTRKHPYIWNALKWVVFPALLALALVFSGGMAGFAAASALALYLLAATAMVALVGNGANEIRKAVVATRKEAKEKKEREALAKQAKKDLDAKKEEEKSPSLPPTPKSATPPPTPPETELQTLEKEVAELTVGLQAAQAEQVKLQQAQTEADTAVTTAEQAKVLKETEANQINVELETLQKQIAEKLKADPNDAEVANLKIQANDKSGKAATLKQEIETLTSQLGTLKKAAQAKQTAAQGSVEAVQKAEKDKAAKEELLRVAREKAVTEKAAADEAAKQAAEKAAADEAAKQAAEKAAADEAAKQAAEKAAADEAAKQAAEKAAADEAAKQAAEKAAADEAAKQAAAKAAADEAAKQAAAKAAADEAAKQAAAKAAADEAAKQAAAKAAADEAAKQAAEKAAADEAAKQAAAKAAADEAKKAENERKAKKSPPGSLSIPNPAPSSSSSSVKNILNVFGGGKNKKDAPKQQEMKSDAPPAPVTAPAAAPTSTSSETSSKPAPFSVNPSLAGRRASLEAFFNKDLANNPKRQTSGGSTGSTTPPTPTIHQDLPSPSLQPGGMGGGTTG